MDIHSMFEPADLWVLFQPGPMTLHCAPLSPQSFPENQMVFNTSKKHLHHLALQNRLLWPKSNICKIIHVTFEKLRVMSCQQMSSPQLLTTALPAWPTQSWVHWILDFRYWDIGIFFTFASHKIFIVRPLSCRSNHTVPSSFSVLVALHLLRLMTIMKIIYL